MKIVYVIITILILSTKKIAACVPSPDYPEACDYSIRIKSLQVIKNEPEKLLSTLGMLIAFILVFFLLKRIFHRKNTRKGKRVFIYLFLLLLSTATIWIMFSNALFIRLYIP